jgi:pimeloyl-ACP methyl ester carboxylesterase
MQRAILLPSAARQSGCRWIALRRASRSPLRPSTKGVLSLLPLTGLFLLTLDKSRPRMNIVFIHGHRATATSFNFLATQLIGHHRIFLEYDSMKGFYRNHVEMTEALQGINDIFFVAHSLGGIHALHLATELQYRVLGAVTMSTPYGGSEAAELLLYLMPFEQVLQDIQPQGTPIMVSRKFRIIRPWTNIVSVSGNSAFMISPNDGVVTLKSMQYRDDMKLVQVACNHYEILQSFESLRIIRNAIAEVENEMHRHAGHSRIHATS